jgi:hypothetical protein
MSEEKKKECKKTLYDWSFMEMKNPRPGVREKTLEFFRNNPTFITIRGVQELRPDTKPSKKEDEETAPE